MPSLLTDLMVAVWFWVVVLALIHFYLVFRWLFHRCECCHARNSSVSDWSFKIQGGKWFCGECGMGVCNFDCHGVPWRQQEHYGSP